MENDWQKKYLDEFNEKLKNQQKEPKQSVNPEVKKEAVPPKEANKNPIQNSVNKNTPTSQSINNKSNSFAQSSNKNNSTTQNSGNRNNTVNANKNVNSQTSQKSGKSQNNNSNNSNSRGGNTNTSQKSGQNNNSQNNRGRNNRDQRNSNNPRNQQNTQNRNSQQNQNQNNNARRTEQKTPTPPVSKTRIVNGLVISIRAREYKVFADTKEYICTVQDAVLRQGPIYIGDKVRVALGQDGRSVIEKCEPRQNVFLSPTAKKEDIVLATNVNQVILVISVQEPMLRTDWLDRHLVVCERKGFKPTILVNKIDLAEDNTFLEIMNAYRIMGYKVIYTTSAALSGLFELKNMFKGKTTVFTGHTGVGKTTLVEMLMESEMEAIPDDPDNYDMTIVDDYVEATKTVESHRLREGGILIDTPGTSDYELEGLDKKELKKYFRDLRNFSAQCSMPDCNHIDETHCQVKKAAENGSISVDRYQNYVKMFEGL